MTSDNSRPDISSDILLHRNPKITPDITLEITSEMLFHGFSQML